MLMAFRWSVICFYLMHAVSPVVEKLNKSFNVRTKRHIYIYIYVYLILFSLSQLRILNTLYTDVALRQVAIATHSNNTVLYQRENTHLNL